MRSSIGRWTIEERLGRGGMGAVFRARDAGGRAVALKLLAPELATNLEARARFEREERLARAIDDAHVARLVDSGNDAGVLFLAFELARDGSLEERLREAGPLPWREAARRGAAIARGLAALHSRGLVHRDVKPGNVLLDGDRTFLADLGLAGYEASATSLGGLSRGLTATGEVLGTPAYSAPEQLRGERVGPAADVYALGATLVALLTGEPPFRGDALAVARQQLDSRPVAPSARAKDVPPELDALVLRLLAKEPRERGDSAAVARELDAIAASAPGRRARAVALAVVVLAGVAAGLAVVGSRAKAPPQVPSPAAPPRPSPSPSTAQGERLARSIADEYERRGGWTEEMKHDVERALALAPRSSLAWTLRSQWIAATGDLDRALVDVDRALELDPGSSRARVQRGYVRLLQGSPRDAAADGESALRLEPRSLGALRLLTVAYTNLDETAKALAAARRVNEVEPDRASNLTLLARLLFDSGDFEGAIAAADRAVELEPRSSEVRLVRARHRGGRGDHAGALEDLNVAIEVDPTSKRALHFERAQVLAAMRRADEAIRDLDVTLARDPRNWAAWQLRAEALIMKRDLPGAIESATRSLDLHACPRTRIIRGAAYERLLRPLDARADYEAAKQIPGIAPDELAECERGLERLSHPPRAEAR